MSAVNIDHSSHVNVIHSVSLKVIDFVVNENPLRDYILQYRYNNSGLLRESSEYIVNERRKQAVVRKHNKPRPVLRIAASRGFSELTKNVIRSSRGHSTPSLKISCKSVQPFSRNLANKQTNKQTNNSIENNTPSPIVSRAG